jgi:hypothetical protein
MEVVMPHGLEVAIDMSPALLGDPDPQLPASNIKHDVIGQWVVYEF